MSEYYIAHDWGKTPKAKVKAYNHKYYMEHPEKWKKKKSVNDQFVDAYDKQIKLGKELDKKAGKTKEGYADYSTLSKKDLDRSAKTSKRYVKALNKALKTPMGRIANAVSAKTRVKIGKMFKKIGKLKLGRISKSARAWGGIMTEGDMWSKY